MASFMTVTSASAKTPATAIPPLAPDARTSDRRDVQERIDLEFARYQEMRDEVRKHFAQLRRTAMTRHPN